MASAQSAVSELLKVLRTGEAVNLIRESVRMVMQELIDTEATDVIGAARYERTDSRVTERNGSRPRTLATRSSTASGAAGSGGVSPRSIPRPGQGRRAQQDHGPRGPITPAQPGPARPLTDDQV
jgi:mutator family transposase